MLSNLDISVKNAVQQILTTFKGTDGRDIEWQMSATFELTMRLYRLPVAHACALKACDGKLW